ncbi:GTPase-activating protein gyp7, partial [Phtheirospermum japonicum]
HQWRSLFTPDGKLRDSGLKLIKKVRSGGVDPSIRAEVWPFLLGVYDQTSSKEERDATRTKNRKEYERLRRHCRRLLKHNSELFKSNQSNATTRGGGQSLSEGTDSPASEDVVSTHESLSSEQKLHNKDSNEYQPSISTTDPHLASSKRITDPNVASDSDSSNSDSSNNPEVSQTFDFTKNTEDHDHKMEIQSKPHSRENFANWQRITRLDAIRANEEWMDYNPTLDAVSDSKSCRAAEAVRLKDYDHLGPARIFHATHLVAILEAYAFYDPEILHAAFQ